MKLTLAELSALPQPVAVTIHSLDGSLYQMTAQVGDREYLVTNDDGTVYRSRKLQALRNDLEKLPVMRVTLRHTSAYDEMVGQPKREASNALEVTLCHRSVS